MSRAVQRSNWLPNSVFVPESTNGLSWKVRLYRGVARQRQALKTQACLGEIPPRIPDMAGEGRAGASFK